MAISRFAGVPVRIAHCHTVRAIWSTGLLNGISCRLGRSLVRIFASQGLACSEGAAEYMFGRRWGGNEREEVLYCGIDLSHYAPVVDRDRTRAELRIPPNVKVLGHVGNFSAPKNQSFLVEVFAEISNRLPDTMLCFVGDGGLREAVESQARRSKLQHRIMFLGIADDVPRKMMGIFDAFAMPSLHEGLPLAFLEAQAAGLRCVISDQIPSEAVVEPNSVTSVSLQDRTGWQNALMLALTLPRPNDGIAKMAGGRFDIETSVASLEALYLRSIKAEKHEREKNGSKVSNRSIANISQQGECHGEQK